MFALSHPINQQIEKYHFLDSLIRGFPDYLSAWLKAQGQYEDVQFDDDGNESYVMRDVADTISDRTDFEESLFSQAMLIMVYSYYESIVHKIAVDVGCNDRPSCICFKKGTELSIVNKSNSKFIFNCVRPLRDYLCHNNSGTDPQNITKTQNALRELYENGFVEIDATFKKSKNNNRIFDFKKSIILFIKKEFILDVLNKEYHILRELSEKVGYKTTFIR